MIKCDRCGKETPSTEEICSDCKAEERTRIYESKANELEKLDREWDRLDGMGGQEERQRAIADQMLEILRSKPNPT